VETIEESKCAKEPGRPLFNEMLDRIDRGDANGILCWDIDRLYRNPIDEGRVRWMLQRGVIASIRTPGREYFPCDAGLLMAVESGRAVDHILSMARNLKRTYEEKLRRGQWPGSRTFGYVFDQRTKNIAPHPEQAKIVRTLYEEFATGRLGLDAGARRLLEFGVKTRTGEPLSKSHMRKLLTARRYTGVMVWKGEAFEGKYTPIVPTDLFEAVQKVLKIKSKPRKVRKGHNFAFCGLFRCSCGSMITAQWAKGHGGLYRYYRCARKSGRPCAEPYLREEHLAAQCMKMLRPLALSAEEAAGLHAVIEVEAEKEQGALAGVFQKTDEALHDVEQKLRKLTHCLLDGVVDEDSYRLSKEDLIVEKSRLKQEKQRLQRSRENCWIEPARKVVSALESLGKNEVLQNLPEISGLVQKVGTNHRISRKTVSFSISEPYDFTLSLLGKMRLELSDNPSLHADANWWSTKWCLIMNHLRTFYQGQAAASTAGDRGS
jgi:hypothetical protein